MNPFQVLVRPLLSEKSNKARESANKYSFVVERKATKADVKKAVVPLAEGHKIDVTTGL